MPRIGDQLLDSVVYLYKNYGAADRGEQAGGSGFIVGQPTRLGTFLYAVTCKHVAFGGAPVARLRTREGEHRIREDLPWVDHPDGDDVAIAFLDVVPTDMEGNANFSFAWIPRAWFAILEDLQPPSDSAAYETFVENEGLVQKNPALMKGDYWPAQWGAFIGAGDDTVMIGRFLGEDGKETNHPTVRFGNLTSPHAADLKVGKSGQTQESLMVEVRSLHGYSGSAVVLYHDATTFNGLTPPVPESPARCRLLGMDFGELTVPPDAKSAFDYRVELAMPDAPLDDRLRSGVMAVLPAWRIAVLLDFQAAQDEEERDSDSDVELHAFTDLLGKIGQVPKSEVDELRRREREDG